MIRRLFVCDQFNYTKRPEGFLKKTLPVLLAKLINLSVFVARVVRTMKTQPASTSAVLPVDSPRSVSRVTM